MGYMIRKVKWATKVKKVRASYILKDAGGDYLEGKNPLAILIKVIERVPNPVQ